MRNVFEKYRTLLSGPLCGLIRLFPLLVMLVLIGCKEIGPDMGDANNGGGGGGFADDGGPDPDSDPDDDTENLVVLPEPAAPRAVVAPHRRSMRGVTL